MTYTLVDLLRKMVESGASDLHLKAGSSPGFRIDGKVKPQPELGILGPDDMHRMAQEVLSEEQLEVFESEGDLDCSLAIKDLARFRVNVLTQRNTIGMVFRAIPESIPSIETLGLPDICKELVMRPRGLVLVTGPTGSGKSTTLASLIDYINRNLEGHILTMEDPLEFIHRDQMCYVTQRQIGSDCKSFKQALRRGLRQDPDVILIGELRDLETIELALTAAETGHLVVATLHTTSAISTVDRIIDVFPSDAQQQIRIQLSNSLQGVISQCLATHVQGGRVAAAEILVATDGVRAMIREGKSAQLLNFLQTGSRYGMNTLEQALLQLVNEGEIPLDEAISKANRPQDIRKGARAPKKIVADPMEQDYVRPSVAAEPPPSSSRHPSQAETVDRRRNPTPPVPSRAAIPPAIPPAPTETSVPPPADPPAAAPVNQPTHPRKRNRRRGGLFG